MQPNPAPYRTNLAAIVAARRQDAGMTQQQLAEALGTTQHTISQCENAYAPTPRLALLLRLAALFRTSLDALCGRHATAPQHDAAWCALGRRLSVEDKAFLMARGELYLAHAPVDLAAWRTQRRAHA